MLRWIIGFSMVYVFIGCTPERQGYLLSPQNNTSLPYHAIPMKEDSLRGATYLSGIFTMGSANARLADGLYALQGNIHRSNNLGLIQIYYGANLTLGSYLISDFYNYSHYPGYPTAGDSLNHTPSSTHSFGSYGIMGGLNIVKTHSHIRKSTFSEWRILGLETSLQNEFGNYADYRHSLPDSAMNIIFRKHFNAYLGIYTEWLWTSRNKMEYGIKLSAGTDLNQTANFSNYYAYSIFPLYTFSIAVHVRKDRFVGFVQTNMSNYAANVQLGFNYRLGKSKTHQH